MIFVGCKNDFTQCITSVAPIILCIIVEVAKANFEMVQNTKHFPAFLEILTEIENIRNHIYMINISLHWP